MAAVVGKAASEDGLVSLLEDHQSQSSAFSFQELCESMSKPQAEKLFKALATHAGAALTRLDRADDDNDDDEQERDDDGNADDDDEQDEESESTIKARNVLKAAVLLMKTYLCIVKEGGVQTPRSLTALVVQLHDALFEITDEALQRYICRICEMYYTAELPERHLLVTQMLPLLLLHALDDEATQVRSKDAKNREGTGHEQRERDKEARLSSGPCHRFSLAGWLLDRPVSISGAFGCSDLDLLPPPRLPSDFPRVRLVFVFGPSALCCCTRPT